MRSAVLFLLACSLWGQQTSTTPDIQTQFAFTGNANSSAIAARSTPTGTPVVAWRVTYEAPVTVTGLSVTLQGAPDNGSGAPGTWVTYNGTVDEGSNPMTTLTTGAFDVRPGTSGIYYPWVRIAFGSYAGSGTVNVKLLGYRGTDSFPVGGSSSIPTPLPVTSLCNTTVQVSLSGTGYTQIIAGSGAKIIYLCKVFVTSASMGTPTLNTFNFAFGACAGSPVEFLSGAGVTGLDEDFNGATQSTGGEAFCVEESTANSDLVTATYLQK
jgi:hypothetical protein